MTEQKFYSTHEIARHNRPNDCWVVIEGQVWDLTEFAPKHPGGEGGEFSGFLEAARTATDENDDEK
jgi:cytochrome b involved in lipid metabolism